MDDVFFKKLKQVNISEDIEKTKVRLKKTWDNADKKNKKELLKNAGPAIYNAIGKITKSGRITAKMTIMLSRYLDVNPFYLIGASNDKVPYSEILLKEFLINLGYKSLWTEYEKYLLKFDMANIGGAEKEEGEEEFEILHTGEEMQDMDVEKELMEIPEDTVIPESLQAADNLSEEEVLLLMRSLLIRAKVNPGISKIADRIKTLLLLN
jgi:hypothetical protein